MRRSHKNLLIVPVAELRMVVTGDDMDATFRGERVLIVDDEVIDLRILSSILSPHFRVSVADSGRRALEILDGNRDFDIFLLDIMMPDINGIELCKIIKKRNEFSDTPVIFISGISDIEGKRSAFEAGGVDYIVKPFEREEVLLRVETHLRIRRLQRELLDKNKKLEENYRRLKELEALKENLTKMIIHDLRSPLTGVLSMFELIKMECSNTPDQDILKYANSGYNAASSLLEMINSLLDISRLEEGRFPLDIKSSSISLIVDEAIWSIAANTGRLEIVKDIKEDVVIDCDRDVIKRVLINLISNSLKHSHSKSPIRVEVKRVDEGVMVSVIDDGIGIPEEYHEKIFEKFGQVQMREEKKRYSTGLGLTFCKLAIEAHNGRIGVESKVGQGSRFYFILPVTKNNESNA